MFNPRAGTCFGFFAGSQKISCQSCVAARRCKAILVSDGFDVMGALVEQLIAELPDDVVFIDSEQVSAWVDQLLHPVTEISKEEAELLGLVNQVPPEGLDLGNL